MKIVLGHVYYLAEDPVEQKVMRPYPPLGLLYIAAYLRENGVETLVFDGTFRSQSEFEGFLINEKPETIGLYANFLTRKNILRVIKFIKSENSLSRSKIIIGGPDARFHAKDYLENKADYVVSGEGEVTFLELISALKHGSDVAAVKGISFNNDQHDVHFTGERTHLKDIDRLAVPARDKIDMVSYLETWKKYQGYSSLTVNTQRGCPFTCRWCSHAVFGDSYRRRSPEKVVEELASLNEQYNPDRYWFVDDVFTMSEKWLTLFDQSLKKSNVKIAYECISRADKLNESIIRTLKSSGCQLLWIGAESGSQRVLDLMDRRVEAEKVREMIRLAKSYGIETGTFIMLGYPGETMEDIRLSVDHLKKSDPDHFTINLTYPIKGTKLYDQVEHVIEKADWSEVPDRDLEFERGYSKRFYRFALRKIYNEVYASKSKKNTDILSFLKFKSKSLAAGMLMRFLK